MNRLFSALTLATAAALQVQAANYSSGLIAYYPFNGNANDESGNGHTGFVTGARLVEDRHGNSSGAYYFTNKGDKVSLPSLPYLTNTSFTISAWVFRDNGGVRAPVFDQGDEVLLNKRIVFGCRPASYPGFPANSFYFGYWANDLEAGANSSSFLQWEHWTGTYDRESGQRTLYKNGVEMGSDRSPAPLPSTGGTRIGCAANDIDYMPFGGSIDEVRIYNRALCSNEVSQLFAYAEARYVVTFDPQGGEVSPTNKTVTFDTAYGALPEPARTGYTFTGWTASTNGAVFGVASDTVVAVASDHTLAATWAANTYTATFDAAGGSVTPATKTVTYGAAYGALPVPSLAAPVRVNYVFGGWFTEADGAGARVTDATLVTEASGHTLYAKWTAEPYVCEPAEEDAARGPAGSYDGYFYGEKEFNGAAALSVRGTLTLKVAGAAGRLTAKAALQAGNLSFSAKAWTGAESDGSFRAVLAGKGGETLDLRVRQGRVWGTLANGSLGGETLTLDGGRNRFADSADAGAPALLESFRGYYTVALPLAEEGVSASSEVAAAPQGTGYLTVTVGNKGSAKIAGVLADGTKVSRASRLILFDGCGPEACVPFFAPLYTKKGWSGGLLWLTPNRGKAVTDRDLGWFIRWENPGAGPDGFSELLDACGGFYGTGAALASAYLFSAEVGDVPYHTGGGEAAEFAAAPADVEVAAAGSRLTIAKGARPAKVTEDGAAWYAYDEANPTSATLSYSAKTGIFKGRFSLYYDYDDAAGRLQHKTVAVPYAGVLTPVRDAAFAAEPAGMGHCLVPDNDPAVKAYRIKRSFPVRLDTAP